MSGYEVFDVAPGFGSPEWYDRAIDWMAEHEPFEARHRIQRLVGARNEVARRYGKPERTMPTHVSWYLMVEARIGYIELLAGGAACSCGASTHQAFRAPTRSARRRR